MINSATLLLTQSPSQTLNQHHLECYLSESTQPNLHVLQDFKVENQDFHRVPTNDADEFKVNSLRDLNFRLKILEIFTLHVLPRNGEWQYAKEFISISELLDEDKREVFLQTLHSLQDDNSKEKEHEAAILRQEEERLRRDRESIEQQRAEKAKTEQLSANGRARSKGCKRTDSEGDYGIEDPPPISKPSTKIPASNGLKEIPVQSKSGKLSSATNRVSTSKTQRTTSIYKRGVALVVSLQHLINNMTRSVSKNPMVLMRTILFLMGLVYALSRQNVRDRVNRMTEQGWNKLKGTVGMGIKISYL